MKNKIVFTLLFGFISSVYAQPIISSFSPKKGKPGETVVLSGSGFNSTSSNNIVRIGGIQCSVSSGSSTSLTVVLPDQITNDYFYVTDVPNTLMCKSTSMFMVQSDSTNTTFSAVSFANKISLSAGATAGYLNAGFGMADLDEDGDFDIALFENTSSSLLHLSNDWTSGALTSSSFSATTLKSSAFANTQCQSTLLMDIDSDGDLDFYCARSASSTEYSKVYLNTSTTSLSINTTGIDITGMGFYGGNPVMADFNQDGLMDHVSSYSWWAHVAENKGTSTPSFAYYGLSNSSYGSTVYAIPVDINNDGIFDVVTGGSTTTYGFKWAGNNTTANAAAASYSFSAISYLPTVQANSSVSEGDFNNDGKMDVLAYRNNSATIFQNNSTSTSSYGFASGSNLSIGSLSFYAVRFADMDNDGFLDILAGTNSGNGINAVHYFRNTTTSTGGSISFATGIKIIDGIGSVVHQIEVVDLNEDGFLDIITKATTATTIDIHLNTGNNVPTYYIKSTGVSAITTLSNWTYNNDGTGNNPPSFAINAVFNLSNSANSTTFTLGAASWTITDGKLVIPSGATLTVPANRTLTLTNANLANSGTITGTTGIIAITGSGNTTFTGTNSIGTLTLNTSGNVTVASTATLNIYNSLNLTAVGTFTTNGNVNLKSISTRTAIMGVANGTVSGNINCELYIAGGYRKFRFLAHPFSSNQNLSLLTDDIDITGSGGSTNGFTSTTANNPSAFWFNPSNGDGATYDAGWTAFSSASGGTGNVWAPGQGIRTLIRGAKNEGLDGSTYTPSAVTLDMSGPVNIGDVTVNLDYAGSNNSQGLNLLGNPYASPIDVSSLVYNSSAASNINKTIYTRNARQGSYTTDVITSGTVYSIPAYSAFFLKTSASSASVTFTESMKQTTSSLSTFLGMGDEQTPNLLRISALIRKEQFDKVDFHFGNEYGDTLDKIYDAFKMINDYFNLYSLTSNKSKVAIDFRNLDTLKLIPLGLSIAKNAKDTIELVFDANNTNAGLYLYDYLTQVKTPIKAGNTYTITVDANAPETIGDNRLVIGSISALEQLSTKLKNEICMTVYPNPVRDILNIQTLNYHRKAKVKLFNLSGIEIISSDIDFSDSKIGSIDAKNLESGIYLVEVIAENGQKYTTKVIK